MLARNTYDRSAGLAGYTRDNAPKAAAAIPEQYDLDDDDDIEEDGDTEEQTPQVWQASVMCRRSQCFSRHQHGTVRIV